MGGGRSTTTHRETKVPNDYNDAWIRSKFGDLDKQGLEYSNWMAGREATLADEKAMRTQNQSLISQLQSQSAVRDEQIKNLQAGTQALTSDYAGLSGQQLATAKDLFNLSRQPGSNVTQQRTQQGLTYVKPGRTRTDLQTGSLNV